MKQTWNGYERIDFLFEGREAILVIPREPNQERNWLLKTEYFGAFPSFEVEMLARGWHLAFIKNVTRWCLDEDLDLKRRFADHLREGYGLAEKCVPVGMSCGGMIACKLAAKYPEIISALYLDAPVMNLLSCPAGLGLAGDGMMQEFTRATGMTLADLICYREHPMDKIPELIKNNIPIVMVYGDSDDVVPYSENGAMLEAQYRRAGTELLTIGKSGCGHHPHGLEDNSPIIEFVERHTRTDLFENA